MFRKTLTSLLLGTTLLSTACSKQADKASPAVREQEATGNSNAGSAATQDLPPHPERAAEPIDSVIDRKHVDLAAKPTDSPVTTTPTAVATGYAGLAKGEKDSSGEAYKNYGQNPWTSADKDHLSTFAADVDTASYTIARRKLNEGALPPAAAVRVEEFVNYFDYAFADPTTGTPFSVIMQAAPSPVNPARHILRVGVATKVKAEEARKPANLVFLVDVSGSMQSPDKLELAKKSLRILTQNLKEGDTVALVTYAGSTRVVLKPTGMQHKARILSALEELTAGGSTAMGSGIDLAYQQAMQGLRPGVTSRVIVLSDGDANVGKATHDDILKLISGRVKEGVTLSTIGFGTGNYKDELMEQLANKGNGNNFYIDSIDAAKKVFEKQLGSTLEVVAKDAKFQIDFDAKLVSRYRLVGYENRDIADNDFRVDTVDAGEIGAGHQVTALYEVELTDAGKQANAPIATVRIRHKEPTGQKAIESAFPMIGGPVASFANAPADFRFAFAVAAFADVLRGGEDAEHWSLAQIRDVAKGAAGDSADRQELVGLIGKAIALKGRSASR
ncbi:MAG: von Willebrand factor type A domain-containing protein [Deltaproteobacteria bacterium]|nr:von Willebrand factor type A domain-containing protein [Deltaproteobacteria bacterium]